MRLISYLFLLLPFLGMAQDTLRYDTAISRIEGESIKLKYKSAVTGGKHYMFLKKGQWLYYDEYDQLVKEENYKAYKSDQKYLKHGYEVYYSPNTGDTILIREYNKGSITKQFAYKEAIIMEKNYIIHVHRDFSSFSVQEYRNTKNNPYRKDFASVWKSSFEGSDMKQEFADYSLIEDSLGDPSLLEAPKFSTTSRFNYVNNPEFEVHPKAPFSIMSFTNEVDYWIQASESPDFYIAPDNAHSGGSFIGFRVFSMSKHIEYVQNKLKAPLKKDSLYCFSAYVRLAPGSKFATNAFGVQFSTLPNKINTDELLTVRADITLSDQLLCYKTRWMKVECTYKAKGGEVWMTIGSFQDHKALNLVEVPGLKNECYYFLDDVSLNPVKDESECGCNFSDQRSKEKETIDVDDEQLTALEELEVGESFILNDINFENDKAELLPTSFKTLYEVLEILKKKPSMVIELSGHTSGLGAYDHNMELSERRAEAVKQFLTLNGIKADRIKTVGHGPNFKIADDSTEEGQRINRRVEFKLLAK